jgi:type IV secretion system protein VirB1
MAGLLPSLLLCAATVHPDTIHDIALVESSFNPFAIAEIVPRLKKDDKGVISHLPKSKNEALEILKRIQDKNRRYSVGLMQIYSGNFKKYNVKPEDMLDGCNNLKVFEQIITECYTRGKTLENALSCYYSGNFETGKKKETEFDNTSYVERIGYNNKSGYVVPSTKIDKSGKDIEIEKGGEKTGNVKIIYPDRVLKNSFISVTQPTKIVKG